MYTIFCSNLLLMHSYFQKTAKTMFAERRIKPVIPIIIFVVSILILFCCQQLTPTITRNDNTCIH